MSETAEHNHIKSADLCDRCLYDLDNNGCRGKSCKDCEQCNPNTKFCKCSEIGFGTPCPYFKEASDE